MSSLSDFVSTTARNSRCMMLIGMSASEHRTMGSRPACERQRCTRDGTSDSSSVSLYMCGALSGLAIAGKWKTVA